MQYQFRIISMSADLLNSRTVFTVEVLEDLGIAVRVRDRLNITLQKKFTAIDDATQKEVTDYLMANAAVLGLE